MNKHKLLIHIIILTIIIIGSVVYFYVFNDYQEVFKNNWIALILMLFVIHFLIELFFGQLVKYLQQKTPHIFKPTNSLPSTPLQWKIYNFAMMFFVAMYVLFFVVLGLAILIIAGMWVWAYYFNS